MSILTAQESFRRGLSAMMDDNYRDAAVFFHRAMDIEKQFGVRHPEMRYLSYYGLSLAKSRRALTEAIEVCEAAVRREALDPDLFMNLGRVYMLAGKTTRALQAFEQGLRIDPNNLILIAERARVDRRSRPVVPGLARSHRVNKLLGLARTAVQSRMHGRIHGTPAAGHS